MSDKDELVEIAFLGSMSANDRALALPLSAYAERNLLKRRLRAALSAIEAAGYVIVPRVPNHDMTAAVVEPGEDRTWAVKAYTAMIEAIPLHKEKTDG